MRPHALAAGLIAAACALPAAAAEPPLERVPSRPVASFPAGTFLESVAVTGTGDLLVAEYVKGDVLRVTPAGTATIATIPGGATGIALDRDGTAIVTGSGGDIPSVTVLGPDGKVLSRIPVAGAKFLNGAALLTPGLFLVADSATGQIFEVDVAAKRTRVWLEHDLLRPSAKAPRLPGANGIKVHGGEAYVTNSGQGTLVRVPIDVNCRPGVPRVWLKDIVLDDFALAEDGTLYATTHINDTVVRIGQDGRVATIATAADGVTGSTALAFGRRGEDATQVYVVGDGGAFQKGERPLVPAQVVRLEVGRRGQPPGGG